MTDFHMGQDPGHGGLTQHKGTRANCSAPGCAEGQMCSSCGRSENECWYRPESCCDICLTCAGFTHDGSVS